MHFVSLSHAEAADSRVIGNIAKYLLSIAPGTHLIAPGTHLIAPDDAPDVGVEVAPRPLPLPAPEVAFAPSTAAAAAPSTAPTTSIAIAPVSPTPAPPSAPAAAAPTAPAAPPSPAGGGGTEVDGRGLPWDARIHAPSKLKNQDGSWRQKRGVATDLVAQVEAELRGLMALPAAPAPVAPTAPLPPNSIFAVGDAAAAAEVAPEPPAAPAITKFADLMVWLTPLMTAQKISQPAMIAAMVGIGMPPDNPLGGLAIREDMVPQAHAALMRIAA